MILTRFKSFFQTSLRFLITAFVCTLLVFSSVLPAQAIDNSNLREGEANLNKIQKESDDVAKSNPRGIEEVTEKAKKGTNAVQGAADKEKMVTPDETKATSIEEKANEFFQNLTN